MSDYFRFGHRLVPVDEADWFGYATQPDHPRVIDPAYSRSISLAQAQAIACEAAAEKSSPDWLVDDYCDFHGIYGEERSAVLSVVRQEWRVLADFFELGQ